MKSFSFSNNQASHVNVKNDKRWTHWINVWNLGCEIEDDFVRFEMWRIRCDYFHFLENVVHTFLTIVWHLQQGWRFLRHSEYRQKRFKIISNHATNNHWYDTCLQQKDGCILSERVSFCGFRWRNIDSWISEYQETDSPWFSDIFWYLGNLKRILLDHSTCSLANAKKEDNY